MDVKPTTGRTALVAVLVAALAAAVLGLLTFGVQATVRPDGVPLALAVPESGGPPAQLVERITTQGGGQVSWRVTDPEQAQEALDDKDVYGVLELRTSPDGLTPRVVLSGAVNPSGTQVAQQILVGVAQGLSAGSPSGAARPVEVVTLHPASAAARTAPLAASTLLWIGTLAAGGVLVALSQRAGRTVRPGIRLAVAVGAAVAATGSVLGLLALWDSSMNLGWQVVGFLLLVGLAFAAIQGAVLRLLGLAGMALLVPLYLLAPSVAGQVPELLHPAYRAALWSWTPFRFSTEGLRSLLQLDSPAPDVVEALWLFGVLSALGVLVLAWPSGRRREDARTS